LPAAQEGKHYVEIPLYIASATEAYGAQMYIHVDNFELTKYIHNALSIDVLVKTTKDADEAYVGTFTGKDLSAGTVDMAITGLTEVPAAYEKDENGVYGTEVVNYAVVTLRVYFDGNMQMNEQYVVRNASMDTAPIGFGVTINSSAS
jgi:hypothetical protein